jgi:hypothetical protein
LPPGVKGAVAALCAVRMECLIVVGHILPVFPEEAIAAPSVAFLCLKLTRQSRY